MAAIEREDHAVLREVGGLQGFGEEVTGSYSFGGVNRRGPYGFGEKREDQVVLECSFLPRGLGSRRDFAGKKRGERTLAGGT